MTSFTSSTLRLVLLVLTTMMKIPILFAMDDGSPPFLQEMSDYIQIGTNRAEAPPLTPPLESFIVDTNSDPPPPSLVEESSIASGYQEPSGWRGGTRIMDPNCTQSQSHFDGEQIVHREQSCIHSVSGLNPNALPFHPVLPSLNSTRDHQVFQSLAEMMRGIKTNDPNTREWLQFMAQCAQSGDCKVVDLCDSYSTRFKCNEQGDLEVMLLGGSRLSGVLDLGAIPDTVKILRIRRNSITNIGQWIDLKGKALWHLDIRRNSELILDLCQLEVGREPLPLRALVVTPMQIQGFFKRTDPRVWVMRSMLNSLTVKRHHDIIYFNNGTVKRKFSNTRDW